MKNDKQSVRLVYLMIYLVFLVVMNHVAFGHWLPVTPEKSLWFYSGAAALILGSLLISPFFTSPANAISFLIAAIVAIFTIPVSGTELVDTLPRLSILIFCMSMLIICTLNILLKDKTSRIFRNVANSCRIIAEYLGSPRFIYALVIIYSLIVYHRRSPKELIIVGISGIIIAAQQPLETFGIAIRRIREFWQPRIAPNTIGSMIAHQTPDVVLIRQESDEVIHPGMCLLVLDKHAHLRIAVTLGYFGRDDGLLIRALEIDVPGIDRTRLKELGQFLSEGDAIHLECQELDAFRNEVYILKHLDSFIGIVTIDTSIERLLFDIVQENDIEQGRLVETFVCGERVLYQVLDGLTKEEIIQQKNTYGFARGEASQVGIWENEERKFKPCNWIPRLNMPVFLKNIEAKQDNKSAIGYFPSTNYYVEIKNLNEMVTHNTAILGILGIGKSMLAIELVERMVVHGIKVICIDLTNQYEQELKDYLKDTGMKEKIMKLQALGPPGKTKCTKNVEEGGSWRLFATGINEIVNEFVDPKCENSLMILNPSQFEVWRQDSKIYQDTASMASLTPTEITQIISDAALQAVQRLGMTDKARICLVYEEAHSLVPEWNSVAADGDKAATNGTARAILQGRKYGLGCLLITQRTANVTKTILNQCNTIFAMRTFDETGKDFLSNYIGLKYSNKLPTLKERQAVVYGRASSCENPVMIRLNNHEDFVRIFRKRKPQ